MFKRTGISLDGYVRNPASEVQMFGCGFIRQLRQLRISRYGVTVKAQQLERFRLPMRNLGDRVICSKMGASFRTALSLFSFKTDYLSLDEAKLSPRLSLAAATT